MCHLTAVDKLLWLIQNSTVPILNAFLLCARDVQDVIGN